MGPDHPIRYRVARGQDAADLMIEDVSARELAERFGTPLYAYSAAALRERFMALQTAFRAVSPLICYAVKSCPNLGVLRHMASLGAGFDVVSGGELFRAMRAGADPARIVFAGVGKSDDELREALRAGVGLINIESPHEIARLSEIATSLNKTQRVAIRVNPDIHARTHNYTNTGTPDTKFGVTPEVARDLATRAWPGVVVAGAHIHIGSPILDLDVYAAAVKFALDFVAALRAAGAPLDTLDIGGGYAASYKGDPTPEPAAYAARVIDPLRASGLRIILEPGRSIAANSGLLLTRVIRLKRSPKRRFVVVDAAMTELVRPALYDAYHFIWPARDPRPPVTLAPPEGRDDLTAADVVGPVCETGDFLARDRLLPEVAERDLLAVFSAGAYGMSMSSQYNSRPRAAEVLVDGGAAAIVRRRETYEDLIAAESPDAH